MHLGTPEFLWYKETERGEARFQEQFLFPQPVEVLPLKNKQKTHTPLWQSRSILTPRPGSGFEWELMSLE